MTAADPLDLIWGADAIAKALNLKNRRQAFHLLDGGLIPARKVGKTWVASRSALARHFSADAPAEPASFKAPLSDQERKDIVLALLERA